MPKHILKGESQFKKRNMKGESPNKAKFWRKAHPWYIGFGMLRGGWSVKSIFEQEY